MRTVFWLIYGLIILSLLGLPPASMLAQTEAAAPDATDPYEPNNTWQQAAPVTPGTIQAIISDRRDVDFFKITVNQRDSTLRARLARPARRLRPGALQ